MESSDQEHASNPNQRCTHDVEGQKEIKKRQNGRGKGSTEADNYVPETTIEATGHQSSNTETGMEDCSNAKSDQLT